MGRRSDGWKRLAAGPAVRRPTAVVHVIGRKPCGLRGRRAPRSEPHAPSRRPYCALALVLPDCAAHRCRQPPVDGSNGRGVRGRAGARREARATDFHAPTLYVSYTTGGRPPPPTASPLFFSFLTPCLHNSPFSAVARAVLPLTVCASVPRRDAATFRMSNNRGKPQLGRWAFYWEGVSGAAQNVGRFWCRYPIRLLWASGGHPRGQSRLIWVRQGPWILYVEQAGRPAPEEVHGHQDLCPSRLSTLRV
eukprot:scaffold8366_cov121-Isochrysis_galbana.AAC.6